MRLGRIKPPVLHIPLCHGDLEMVDWLLDHGADPNALDVVKWLVERGASINKVKYENEPDVYYERKLLGLGTPLHRGAEFGRASIVTFLLEQGANPLIKDSKGHTPRFWADKKGHLKIVDQLRLAEDQWRAKL